MATTTKLLAAMLFLFAVTMSASLSVAQTTTTITVDIPVPVGCTRSGFFTFCDMPAAEADAVAEPTAVLHSQSATQTEVFVPTNILPRSAVKPFVVVQTDLTTLLTVSTQPVHKAVGAVMVGREPVTDNFDTDAHDDLPQLQDNLDDINNLLFDADPAKTVCGNEQYFIDTDTGKSLKTDIESAFVTKFCGNIDDLEFRQGGMLMYPIAYDVKMLMSLVPTKAEWIYAVEQTLCEKVFMRIVNKCTSGNVFKGGVWTAEGVKFEVRPLQKGGPFKRAAGIEGSESAVDNIDSADNSGISNKAASEALEVFERADEINCDPKNVPFRKDRIRDKAAVRTNFAEPFCKAIKAFNYRSQSVTGNPIRLDTRMVLIIYANRPSVTVAVDERPCVDAFMRIVDKCSTSKNFKGGWGKTDNYGWEIRAIQDGGPFDPAAQSIATVLQTRR